MSQYLYLIVIFFFTFPSAFSQSVHDRCATIELNEFALKKNRSGLEKYLKMEQKHLKYKEKLEILRNRNQIAGRTGKIQQTIQNIKISFHIIGDNATDKITTNHLSTQIDILNAALAGTNINICSEFTYNRIYGTDITSLTWQAQFEECYIRAGYPFAGVYNVYITELPDNDRFAFSIFPWWQYDFGGADGTVIDPDYFALSSTLNYSQGKTLVHEIGHFFGLYHIYGKSNCLDIPSSNGDLCDDTPLQSYVTDALRINCQQRNTCPDDQTTIYDLENNYMDNTYDQCMTEFTQDQIDRMYSFLTFNRSNLIYSSCIETTTENVEEEVEDPFLTTNGILRNYYISKFKILKEKDTNTFTGRDDIHYQSARLISGNCNNNQFGPIVFLKKIENKNNWHFFRDHHSHGHDDWRHAGFGGSNDILKVTFYDVDNAQTQTIPMCGNEYWYYDGRNSPYGTITIETWNFYTPGEKKEFHMGDAVVEITCRNN